MPGILIHLAFGYILYKFITQFKRYESLKNNYVLFLFLLGSLIPDTKFFVANVTNIFTNDESFAVFSSMFVTHQIFGSFLIVLLLSATVFRNKFRMSFACLTIGFLGHFLLDISQYPLASINHMQLLYPISDKIFYINLGFINGISTFEIIRYLILVVALCLFVSKFIFKKELKK